VIRTPKKDVTDAEGQQVLEAAMVLFALVRRRREQEQRLAVIVLAEFLGQFVVLRLLDLLGAVIDGAELMGFVEDDQVPLAAFQ